MRGLVPEILRHKWRNTLVARGFGMLHQHLEHNHARPPVLVDARPELPILALAGKRPLDPRLRFGDQAFIFEQIGQRQQSIQVVWPALPAFATPAKPAALRSHVRPELVKVPAQPLCLNLKLVAQPPKRLNRAERKSEESGWAERRAVL